MDYKQISKEISSCVRKKCQNKFRQIYNEANIYYNIQLYYLLCLDTIEEKITNDHYLYNYEYDIIIKDIMNRHPLKRIMMG